jgi:hypothetical protein
MSWRNKLLLMESEQVHVETSPSAVGTLVLSPVFQDLIAVEIVEAVLFVEAWMCQTAGSSVPSGD